MLTAPPRNADEAIAALLASPEFAPLIAAHRELEPRAPRHAPWPAGVDPRLGTPCAGAGSRRSTPTRRPPTRRRRRGGTSSSSRRPHRARRSATTCRSSTPWRATLPRAPSTSSPPRRSPRTSSSSCARWPTRPTLGLKTHTYDGDTPANIRSVVRAAGQVVITNPDMLHAAILPHHTKWFKLFENLRYVVIDELHTYRGLFGSHVANVIRRLRRICNHYGADPVFICASATIANPRELAERILEAPVELIDDNGAPSGRKHVLVINPPVANEQLGIRGSALLTGQRLAERLIGGGVQTIAFAKSRTAVEVLTSYLRETFAPATRPPAHDSWLPRRLPAERAPRHRGRAARRPRARRGGDERARARHRHRQPRRGDQHRLSRHHRQHVAADGPQSAAAPGRASPR